MADNKKRLESKAKRLAKQEYVIWLTTVDSTNTPQPRPVWFIWDKDSFLIFSQPQAHKVAHIRRNSSVSLHFNTDKTGDQDVIVYLGIATIDEKVKPAHKVSAYFKKYKTGIKDIGMTPEKFSQEYSVAIRVKPSSLRGW
ncbi:MAG: TIGR03667 family PPOX class F420-dependent oxidoreductase [Chloroflexi bacterium]|nr:TIGR03667 family PPOX class F420-dependent oxidoreductase [Chloroflexota bacterium]